MAALSAPQALSVFVQPTPPVGPIPRTAALTTAQGLLAEGAARSEKTRLGYLRLRRFIRIPFEADSNRPATAPVSKGICQSFGNSRQTGRVGRLILAHVCGRTTASVNPKLKSLCCWSSGAVSCQGLGDPRVLEWGVRMGIPRCPPSWHPLSFFDLPSVSHAMLHLILPAETPGQFLNPYHLLHRSTRLPPPRHGKARHARRTVVQWLGKADEVPSLIGRHSLQACANMRIESRSSVNRQVRQLPVVVIHSHKVAMIKLFLDLYQPRGLTNSCPCY
ncbi:hypothetical protein FALCPG4_006315 [Fusarium falciforme]